ncbi:MAG: hypothetical protein IPN29_17175 [Saprospiraceae bacterium]|nr:hypothetical protein [Saprospiraceae bacterium]
MVIKVMQKQKQNVKPANITTPKDGNRIKPVDEKPDTSEIAAKIETPPPPAIVKPSSLTKRTKTCVLKSKAALYGVRQTLNKGTITIIPKTKMVLSRAKLRSRGDGGIDFMLSGGDINSTIEISKHVNDEENDISFNELRNTILEPGFTYTLSFKCRGDSKLYNIENAVVGNSTDQADFSGAIVLFDLEYKYL